MCFFHFFSYQGVFIQLNCAFHGGPVGAYKDTKGTVSGHLLSREDQILTESIFVKHVVWLVCIFLLLSGAGGSQLQMQQPCRAQNQYRGAGQMGACSNWLCVDPVWAQNARRFLAGIITTNSDRALLKSCQEESWAFCNLIHCGTPGRKKCFHC